MEKLTKKQAEKQRIKLYRLGQDLLGQIADITSRYGGLEQTMPADKDKELTELGEHYSNVRKRIEELTILYNLKVIAPKKNTYKSKSNATQVKPGKYAGVKGHKEVLYVSDYSHLNMGELSRKIAKHLKVSSLFVLSPRENLMFMFVVMMEQKDLLDKSLISIQDSLVYQDWFNTKVYKELLCILLGQIKNDIREINTKNLTVLLTDLLTLNRFKRSYKKLKDDYFGGSTIII